MDSKDNKGYGTNLEEDGLPVRLLIQGTWYEGADGRDVDHYDKGLEGADACGQGHIAQGLGEDGGKCLPVKSRASSRAMVPVTKRPFL